MNIPKSYARGTTTHQPPPAGKPASIDGKRATAERGCRAAGKVGTAGGNRSPGRVLVGNTRHPGSDLVSLFPVPQACRCVQPEGGAQGRELLVFYFGVQDSEIEHWREDVDALRRICVITRGCTFFSNRNACITGIAIWFLYTAI